MAGELQARGSKVGDCVALKTISTPAFLAQVTAACPKGVDPDRLIRCVVTAFRINPKLGDCNPHSVYLAVLKAAQMGLEIGIHAYLVPLGKRGQDTKECNLWMSILGKIELVRRSGEVKAVAAEIVYEHDEFDYQLGDAAAIFHRPAGRGFGDRGKPLGGYARVELRGGGVHRELMSKAEIDLIRDRSPGYKNGGDDNPWRKEWGEMARKTVLGRALKRCPISIDVKNQIAEADADDDDGEGHEVGRRQSTLALLGAASDLDLGGAGEDGGGNQSAPPRVVDNQAPAASKPAQDPPKTDTGTAPPADQGQPVVADPATPEEIATLGGRLGYDKSQIAEAAFSEAEVGNLAQATPAQLAKVLAFFKDRKRASAFLAKLIATESK